MTTIRIAAAGAAILAAAPAATFALAAGHRHAAASVNVTGTAVKSVAGSPAVIVELFTSEGCSDCPPADIVLADLARMQPVAGAHVIGLEEHVTYFNGKSWSDPFSEKVLTDRQYEYGRTLRQDQVYTPEMIVDGHDGFVGSNRSWATAQVKAAKRAPRTRVSLTATAGADGSIAVDVLMGALPRGVADAEVFVALTQDGLSSHVLGGENRGRNLLHTSVVRSLIPLGSPDGTSGGTLHTSVSVPAGTPLSACHIVAFVQEPGLGPIIGATDVSLASLK